MLRGIIVFCTVLAAAVAARAQAPASPSVQASPPPVEDYGRLPAMALVRLSPLGDRYAYVTRTEGAGYIIVATTKNEFLTKVPIFKTKVVNLEWAGDDHLIIITSATANLGLGFGVSKSELDGAVSLDLKTPRLVPIFSAPGNVRVAETIVGQYGAALIGDRWYGYFGAYTYSASGQLQSGAWRLVSLLPGGATLASGRNKLGGAHIVGFGKTADRVIISTPVETGVEDVEIPLIGGPAVPVTNEPNGVGELIDPINQLWIGLIHDDDNLTATLFDPLKEAKLRAAEKALPGYIVHLISYSADFSHLIVMTEGRDDSGTYWLINFADRSGTADILGMAYPTIKSDAVGPVRMIDYKAADGLALRGVLTLPPGRAAKNLPVVVMPHGGPVYRDYPGFDYWAQAFAARGYAVFQPKFRGSSGYGGVLRDAGFGQWGRKMQTDLSDGLAELARQGVVDPKRACIVGASYGGYAALAGVTVQQHLYRCAVSVAGVADLDRMLSYEDDKAGWNSSTLRFWKQFMGITSHWSNAQVRDISPVQLADKADAPILLLHGDNDTTVPIDQSQAMKRALEGAGKPVEFVTLPGADHWLLEEDARVAMLKASVAFVLKYDPPDPAPTAVAAK